MRRTQPGIRALKSPKQITDAAKGKACTLNLVNVCNYHAETTSACHLPDGSGGSNRLTGPLSIAFGCSDCHDQIDGRTKQVITDEDMEFYMRRGMMRTLVILHNDGLIKIRGEDY